MTRTRTLLAMLTAASLGAALLGIVSSSCVSESTFAAGDLTCPSEAVFTGELPDGGGMAAGSVSAFIERRCGTMDCHGTNDKPFRLYGRFGLREPAESNFSGGKATTPRERNDNYTTVCLLQPEEMASVVANQGQNAETLLIITKPRGTEAHKGGQVLQKGQYGDNCILGWLRGDEPATVAQNCQNAVACLQPGAGIPCQ